MISPAQEAALQAYEELLRTWAPRLDLISPHDMARLRERHIDDSLSVLPLLEELTPGPCIDVGSGAGLPGIPLAICGPAGFTWRLLEPRKRRAAFLEEALRQLDLGAEVVVKTAEQAAITPDLAGTHTLAVGRALAGPLDAMALLKPLVRPGGAAVVFLGEEAEVPPDAEGRPGWLAIMRRTEVLP